MRLILAGYGRLRKPDAAENMQKKPRMRWAYGAWVDDGAAARLPGYLTSDTGRATYGAFIAA